jgi:hypothetical protein
MATSGSRVRPMSNAVRAGVVQRMSRTMHVSPADRSQVCNRRLAGPCRSWRMSSAGRPASSHLVPSTAAADNLASTASPPAHSQAALARVSGVSVDSLGTYTFRWTAR